MDMIKIGQFLAELRRENNLTQEQLGEEIGVTNKTVSRWENGNYLPPVEMLQLLSNKYGVTINEILSGERLNEQDYKVKAEENISTALNSSVFSVKDKKEYFRKKWLKDHKIELTLEMIILVAAAVVSAIYCKEVCIALSFLSIIWAAWINNRIASYIEWHIYEETKNSLKIDNDNENL